jgi:hypothetical protein
MQTFIKHLPIPKVKKMHANKKKQLEKHQITTEAATTI